MSQTHNNDVSFLSRTLQLQHVRDFHGFVSEGGVKIPGIPGIDGKEGVPMVGVGKLGKPGDAPPSGGNEGSEGLGRVGFDGNGRFGREGRLDIVKRRRVAETLPKPGNDTAMMNKDSNKTLLFAMFAEIRGRGQKQKTRLVWILCCDQCAYI
ncbi:hypothetical protein ACET3Z_022181 [Daucus carota]